MRIGDEESWYFNVIDWSKRLYVEMKFWKRDRCNKILELRAIDIASRRKFESKSSRDEFFPLCNNFNIVRKWSARMELEKEISIYLSIVEKMIQVTKKE